MARLGPLVLIFGLLARCGGGVAVSSPPHVVHVSVALALRHVVLTAGEHRTFQPGRLQPGSAVTCVLQSRKVTIRIPSHPYGSGWAVANEVATPGGKSTG